MAERPALICGVGNRRDICLPLLSFPVTSLGTQYNWAESDWSEPERPPLFGRCCKIQVILTVLGLPFPCFLGIFLATLPFLGAFWGIGQSWSIRCLIFELSVVGAERNKRHLLLSAYNYKMLLRLLSLFRSDSYCGVCWAR